MAKTRPATANGTKASAAYPTSVQGQGPGPGILMG